MIFISAQPARYYFKWQLEVQLFNFNKLGIKPENIHVLFCYDVNEAIDERVVEFAKNNKHGKFFFYPDTRPFSDYEPTCRPHIIKKHFLAYPYLESTEIFYHDCDIIFRELPDFEGMVQDDYWHYSDADAYIGVDHLMSFSTEMVHHMCEIVGVDKGLILNLSASGGAQILTKNTNYFFWDKIERDSNNLFDYLNKQRKFLNQKHKLGGSYKENYEDQNLVQAWCADMWAILWNSILFGHKLKVDPELSFSWAKDPISNWHEHKIFHNAGVTKKDAHRIFYKSDFRVISPYHTNLEYVSDTRCSFMYVNEIKEFIKSSKIDFSDVTFTITCRMDSQERINNILSVVGYLDKFFSTSILLLESDLEQKLNESLLPKQVSYQFIKDESPILKRTMLNNILLAKCKTSIAVIQDSDVIISPDQLISAVKLLREKVVDLIIPYDEKISSVETEKLKNKFLIDPNIDNLLYEHYGHNNQYIPLGGCVLVDRQFYSEIGNDNIFIPGCGPEDIERIVRTILSGGRVKKIKGPIFHLDHPRSENSHYGGENDFTERFQPLLQITNVSKETLVDYIEQIKFKNQQLPI